ncbi:serine/arginine-rich splicing factor 7 isoform X2 [Aplysia californica]|uniref:Serine/arginine-rich splicing factor 7 isoform X2 n=1 Tax=Aplysia californica TaxID=6500 RepID=A0ABM0JH86_APLCA|nr:serine/arginine-rich splicing factor 7 isoform X2 [Aplysia californica]
MSRFRGTPNDSKIYIGDLPKDASEKELERAFSYYGRLRNVWVARNPPGFAFVEFEDYRDAEDAVKELDGTNICGSRCRVELSTGKVRPKPWLRGGRGPPRSRRAFHPDDRCYECGERGHYAYDCSRSRKGGGGGGGSGSGSRKRSYSRSYSRSRSRSRGRQSRTRSRSPAPKSRSRSPSAHSN